MISSSFLARKEGQADGRKEPLAPLVLGCVDHLSRRATFYDLAINQNTGSVGRAFDEMQVVGHKDKSAIIAP